LREGVGLLPYELQAAIEADLMRANHSAVANAAASLQQRYLCESGQGERLVTRNEEALAYALTRMPATYGAVYAALSYALEVVGCDGLSTVLDVGARKSILERSREMWYSE